MFNVYDHAYYYTLKSESRRRVVNSLNNKIRATGTHACWNQMTLCSINEEAIDFARLEWPKAYGPETHNGLPYSWERLYHKFLPRPAFFDLAIWQMVDGNKVLQGMALGKPSNAKTQLNINWVERSFLPSYMLGGILIPVLTCAEEYAKLLGSSRVVIKGAIDPGLFERYGYAPCDLPRIGRCNVKEIECHDAP